MTLDLDPRFGADHQIDFLTIDRLEELERGGRFDIILASPPCESFSTGSFRHHWLATAKCPKHGQTARVSGEVWDCGCRAVPKPYRFKPKTARGRLGRNLMSHTLYLIELYQPTFWVMENPRAMMRNLVPEEIPRVTVTWCQYGDDVMKPTDLWGELPPSFKVKNCKNGDDCHEAAPRGARTGTQGKKDAAARGKIPYGLAYKMCLAAERGLGEGR